MASDGVVIIGAGIGGLACAIDLAAQGVPVAIVERAAQAGGKMRETRVGGRAIDSGPTVFTMRWVFESLFAAAGQRLEQHLGLEPLSVLARHGWSQTQRFDLFADIQASADAVGHFSGPDEARRFLGFCAEAKAIYRTLEQPFLAAAKPGPVTLARRIGLTNMPALFGIRPFETLWRALSGHFHDPRLRQLFGRYATYNGSSPFAAPATLMLIAHVEQDGVWAVQGGMQRLAEALQHVAESLGVAFHFGRHAERILLRRGRVSGLMLDRDELLAAQAVVVNADAAALPSGLFGEAVAGATRGVSPRARSLSACTWSLLARTEGFPLLRHNVFFSQDYRAEFDDLFGGRRLPTAPTVYVCAQDRGGGDEPAPDIERLMLLINAPPTGDQHNFDAEELRTCETRIIALLTHCGLTLTDRPQPALVTTPSDFHRLFPATGGALYGRAAHGWQASFQRPGSASRIPGLYLAGGSTHPGAGVPMAALSGRLAAARLIADRHSTRRFHPAAMFGGTSTG